MDHTTFLQREFGVFFHCILGFRVIMQLVVFAIIGFCWFLLLVLFSGWLSALFLHRHCYVDTGDCGTPFIVSFVVQTVLLYWGTGIYLTHRNYPGTPCLHCVGMGIYMTIPLLIYEYQLSLRGLYREVALDVERSFNH